MTPTRPHPFDLIFGPLADARFPAIRDALDGARDPHAFMLAAPALELLHELRPDEGFGDAVDDFVTFVHAAVLFWVDGSRTVEYWMSPTTRLLCSDDGAERESPRDAPLGAMYIQVAPRLVWGRLADDETFEPLDGWFAIPAGDALHVIGCFGVHPSRPGLTVVEVTGKTPGKIHRDDGTAVFSPIMAGGDMARSSCRGFAPGIALAGVAREWRPGDTLMAVMDRAGVARALEQIASYLELTGENPFRVRAFTGAAKTIEGFPRDLESAIADGSLAQAKGIGPAILQVVSELVSTGHAGILEELREKVPPGLVEMLRISGLGVSKIRLIHDTLGIDSLPDLEIAARDGRLAALPRFGQRTAENILKGIAFLRQASQWRLSHHAHQEARALRDALGRLPHIRAAHVAGEARRCSEVVREVVLVLVADVPPEDVFAQLATLPGASEIAGEDERRATLRLAGGSTVQVVVTPAQNLGAVLVQATGSEAHLAALARHANAKGFNLAGTALWHGSQFVPTPTEESLYAALGLPWMPPELRESGAEVGRPVPELLTRGDLRGFLHCHTTASDGTNSVAELATACRDAGYQYVGITYHSKAAAYAGGLSPEGIRAQWEAIDALNASNPGIRILKGIESDILGDGDLDYPDEILAGFDFVIGSIHSRFNLSEPEMTDRVCRAMRSRYLTILGHPTGRLLLARDAYPIDLERVLATAAEHGVAVEINADPHRLDLDWRMLTRARELGVMISIGADAHNLAGLANVEFGVGIARKGGLGAKDVLNCRDVDGFLAFAQARRS